MLFHEDGGLGFMKILNLHFVKNTKSSNRYRPNFFMDLIYDTHLLTASHNFFLKFPHIEMKNKSLYLVTT